EVRPCVSCAERKPASDDGGDRQDAEENEHRGARGEPASIAGHATLGARGMAGIIEGPLRRYTGERCTSSFPTTMVTSRPASSILHPRSASTRKSPSLRPSATAAAPRTR